MGVVPPLQGIILDVDGTILDSKLHQYNWLKYAAETWGGIAEFPPNDTGFWDSYNEHYKQGMIGLYRMIGVDFETHRGDIWTGYNRFNREHPTPVIPGVDDAIKEIYARSRVSRQKPTALRLALNTTKSWNDIEIPLEAVQLIDCFDTIVTKDDIYSYVTDGESRRKNIPFDDYKTLRQLLDEDTVKLLEKPNSLSAALTLGRLGLEPESTIAVEDTSVGIKAHKNINLPRRRASIYVVGASWGYEDASELAAAGADEIIDSPEQLVEIVDDLGGLNR